MRALLVLLAALPLLASDDANAILQRLVEAEKQNDRLAEQYTYREEATWFTYDKRGQAHPNRSETHEVIFVEGVKYRKLTARNGKPLGVHEAAQVEREMRETAAERRRNPHTAPGGQINLAGTHADVGSLPELLTLYENRVAGEEEIGGRKVWVIEGVPRADHIPASPHEKDLYAFHKKLWIDQDENVLVRMAVTVAGQGLYSTEGALLAAGGSSLTFESAKIDAQVWEQVGITLDIRRRSGKVIRPWARTEYRQSHFQKFDVQSSITVEPPK